MTGPDYTSEVAHDYPTVGYAAIYDHSPLGRECASALGEIVRLRADLAALYNELGIDP